MPIFPEVLDNFTPKENNVDDVVAEDINELQTAIEAIEAKLGINGSIDTNSIDYKLANHDHDADYAAIGHDHDSVYEKLANKSTSVATDASSDTKYPSVKAVKDYADGLVAGLLDYRGGHSASGNTYPTTGGSGTAGAVLKGDMWIISVAGTLGGEAVQIGDSIIANVDSPGQTAANWNHLNSNISYTPENSANKKTDLSDNSDAFYPTQKAVKTAVDGKMSNPMTTEGDIIYGGASGAPTRLAKGTAAQVLKMNAGATAPEWGAASGGGGWELVENVSFSGANNVVTTTIAGNTAEVYMLIVRAVFSTADRLRFRFNDISAGYYGIAHQGRSSGSTVNNVRNNDTGMYLIDGDSCNRMFFSAIINAATAHKYLTGTGYGEDDSNNFYSYTTNYKCSNTANETTSFKLYSMNDNNFAAGSEYWLYKRA